MLKTARTPYRRKRQRRKDVRAARTVNTHTHKVRYT